MPLILDTKDTKVTKVTKSVTKKFNECRPRYRNVAERRRIFEDTLLPLVPRGAERDGSAVTLAVVGSDSRQLGMRVDAAGVEQFEELPSAPLPAAAKF